jgi:pyridoxamine-phosphate oxidase
MATSSGETGHVTGTKDKDYNLIWFTEQCLSNVLRLESYIQDAERDGDSELAEFFRRAQNESRKGGELAENPRAALVFYWRPLGRQVRVEGDVERLDPADSETYFRTRPLQSRYSAWASQQGEVIPDRESLERRFDEAETAYRDDVPLPRHWGGYRLRPHTIEFWQHRDNRLHDRFRYRLEAGAWIVERLSP